MVLVVAVTRSWTMGIMAPRGTAGLCGALRDFANFPLPMEETEAVTEV